MTPTFDIRQVPAQPVLLVRETCTKRGVAPRGYERSGDVWERYLTGPDVPSSGHRTEIFLPVRRRDAH